MSLTEASVVAWDVDVLGEDGMTILSSLEGKICPVCQRRTFWVDFGTPLRFMLRFKLFGLD